MFFVPAKDQTDRWLVIRVAQQVINSIEIKIHFAGVFRQEFSTLKLDHNAAAQFEMIKKQVDIEIIFPFSESDNFATGCGKFEKIYG